MKEKSSLHDLELFDGEMWDNYADIITHLWGRGMTAADIMELMTPIWLEQIDEYRKQGFCIGDLWKS